MIAAKPPTSARDRLGAAQARAAELAARVGQLWSRAETGETVEVGQIVSAEAELAVAQRIVPALQALAQSETEREQHEQWAAIETEVLARHRDLAAEFHARLETARAAVLDVVDQAAQLDVHHQMFVQDRRRPPTTVDGVIQERVDRSVLGTGERLRSPGVADVVLALTADGLDEAGRRGAPSWGEVASIAREVRRGLALPTDPRPIATTEEHTE